MRELNPSIFDLAVSVPQDLLEYCADNDERVALDLVMRAKKTLIDSGALVKDISTAEDLLERRRNLLKCTTGTWRLREKHARNKTRKKRALYYNGLQHRMAA